MLAAKYENTAKKMKAALDASPYRSNVSPESPDIFHLRLGAANFFVPPLTIDVNTSFKSGSLTGGALRQKSSPKFNSGFKETSIRMKLFFPNYEEIWGISIDDASKISLDDNYQIDFNTDGSSNKKIDKFLSSLRGLVAAFKYSPFLPIRNHYLNSVHGVTAVALSSMSISTVPNFPFALAVDIELLNFNHKPFLPMINDFNQAIHWGKYRQYMGKAAGELHKYVNSSFLMKISDDKEDAGSSATSRSILKDGITADRFNANSPAQVISTSSFENNKLVTNIVREWMDGKNISFFIPAETQTKIFLPDSTNFRQDEEKYINDHGEDLWAQILKSFGIDLNESAGYGINLSGVYSLSRNNAVGPSVFANLRNAVNLLTSGINSKTYSESLYAFNANVFVLENNLSAAEANYILTYSSNSAPGGPKREFTFQKNKIGSSEDGITIAQAKQFLKNISSNVSSFLDKQVEDIAMERARKLKIVDTSASMTKEGSKKYNDIKNSIKQQVKDGFNVLLYNRFFQSGPIEALMEAARQKSGSFSFREWEVPMLKVDLDPAFVTVTGVSLTLGNNLAKLQLQMQDEPTYQHIGGRDTYINISMRITSEKELNKLKRIFDHVNALARLEHSTGVLGFIGIKNIVTTLAGVKYVIPSNYSVNTVPNYPHVYDVNISLLDFDIFQQEREKLSSKHQKQLIEEFGSKRNPFLRIKQMWGIFNAYPDLPLDIKDKNNEVVGHLDPDFYFRSFEMFDKDIVNNYSNRPKELDVPTGNKGSGTQNDALFKNAVARKIISLIETYETNLNYSDYKGDKVELEKNLINEVVSYLETSNISYDYFIDIMREVAGNPNLFNSSASSNKSYNLVKKSKKLITDAIEYVDSEKVSDEEARFANRISNTPYQVGDLTTDNDKILTKIQQALNGKFNLKGEDEISFDLDDLDFMGNLFYMPIKDKNEPNKTPAMLSIGSEVHLGYVDEEKDGRFYLTVDGANVKKAKGSHTLSGRKITDDYSDPSKVNVSNSIYSLTAMSKYGQPYANDLESHWEKMLVDTQYRDVSGRMIRAFPTYMLWLIDEGGHFAGVKLFDNFYGLQSIIDFSLVSSEDLVGDTLVIRLSNLYSKLSKKESSSIFNPNLDKYGDEIIQDNPGITEGISGIIDTTLNKSRNILAHMRNEYVVDVENIRIKPGIRVHLRGGYGSNPNSLHTLFNGTITEVEQGEIVTITAQSDAIELGAVVNSTNKKGDSGKIDGGINTGLWLSEPRDLMVRLLSMGTSRFRESIAYSNRGLIFSENKFGIRHFGTILYEPMSREEEQKHFARVEAIADAHKFIGQGNYSASAGSLSDAFLTGTPEHRSGMFSLMNQLWSNLSSQRDFEIFKRNIYPGNGTGIAQFLGGDLGDGWTSLASITPSEQPNQRMEYLSRLTDRSWNSLVTRSDKPQNVAANQVLDDMTSDGQLVKSNSGSVSKSIVMGGVGLAGLALFGTLTAPITGGILAGAGLLGVLSGKTNHIFRMAGLTSAEADDDMPGFDEVSFRAQTYMRSVWDLFKVCARLLPNYIVAIRPFEDRSTVFYGKPHWLYTSGVVPITTGYPNQEKMASLGLSSGPKSINEDKALMEIITKINQQSSPYADASAFLRSSEPIEALTEMTKMQEQSQLYYSPSGYLRNRVINFDSVRSQTVTTQTTANSKETVIAKLPQNKGMVTMGFHLPVRPTFNSRSATADGNLVGLSAKVHAQIPQLPPRYRYPLFAYRGFNSSYKLENYVFQFNQTTYDSVSFLDRIKKGYDTVFNALETGFTLGANKIIDQTVGTRTLATSGQEKLSNYTGAVELIYGKEFAQQLKQDIEIFKNNSISGSASVNPLENSYNFSGFKFSDINYKESDETSMPEPSIKDVVSYNEWTAPRVPIDEQFYVAMRWPYIPKADKNSIDKFKSKYFPSTELVGDVENYKSCHVMVYNPSNNTAVICKPAYFLWGNTVSNFVRPNSTKDLDNLLYGESEMGASELQEFDIAAVVSPDAAFFLGVITNTNAVYAKGDGSFVNGPGYSDLPIPQECYFAFVPNTIPLGVANNVYVPIKKFKAKDDQGKELEDFVIGFGNFVEENGLTAITLKEDDSFYRTNPGLREKKTSINEYAATASIREVDFTAGGNYLGYFQKSFETTESSNGEILVDPVSREAGQGLLENGRGAQTGTNISYQYNDNFAPVFSIADPISVTARKYYDEDYDLTTGVIAGNGRTLEEANDIWNQFRIGYHTYDSVQAIFANTYGLDPNDNTESKDLMTIFMGNPTQLNVFKKFGVSARDEFAILFGNEITGKESQAIEFAKKNLIDASYEDGGLIEYFNELTRSKIIKFQENFLLSNETFLREQISQSYASNSSQAEYLKQQSINVKDNSSTGVTIKTPRQLFLTMVGLFRQAMWSDPYARAWLVLKPSRKVTLFRQQNEDWDFKSVDRIFEAFINPSNTYGKDKKKFLQLLYNNRGEGSSSTSLFSRATSAVDNFWDKNVGVIFSAIGGALTGLLQTFKLNMLQTGYGLSEIGGMSRQANILNKALNDSIYYSLGRDGSLLRAVDNPFTREYGEPVVEIREPFQKIHYLSSFSHILSNQIKETNFNVSTVVTAVSDGKYPVTVALDKGAPADRMTETTVETGIYFDNPVGEGFFGFFHPFLHPFEMSRGAVKNITGSPDELTAKRIALSHLKENIKDIYGGELLVIGNPDIKPHDLVYIADVYERMYGMFEVEQVIHHFTSELGFVTSITPNALVTVNDPARWFMTSWIDSWMNTQAIRNDTRLFLDAIRADNSGITSNGTISIDRLSENLNAQMMGGIKYTHGSSAVIKDVVAAMTHGSFANPQIEEEIKKQAQVNGNNGGIMGAAHIITGVTASGAAGLATASVAGATAVGIGATAAVAAPAALLFGQLIWKGWRWVRDNLLDQHGAYVQYLNKNGQPMDAGLSYNQGMIVGRYHSKALLPGILGLRKKTRTAEGYAYIRTDDQLKALGWTEKQTNELVRYISYENAIIHAQVLDLSGLGPEKTGFEPFFKVFCRLDTNEGLPLGGDKKLSGVKDADTIAVVDVLSGAKFTVRLDGINAPEKSAVTYQYPDDPGNPLQIISKQSPGYKSTAFTYNALKDKVFLLRIKKAANGSFQADLSEDTFAPGSQFNKEQNYLKEIFGRTLATIFYKTSDNELSNIKYSVLNIFKENIKDVSEIRKKFRQSLASLVLGVEQLYMKVEKSTMDLIVENSNPSSVDYNSLKIDHSKNLPGSEILSTIQLKKMYSAMVEIKILDNLYGASSKWPLVLWDEYYDDGTPYTLNWELVINNLANVFTNDLVNKESDSVITAPESAALPQRIG